MPHGLCFMKFPDLFKSPHWGSGPFHLLCTTRYFATLGFPRALSLPALVTFLGLETSDLEISHLGLESERPSLSFTVFLLLFPPGSSFLAIESHCPDLECSEGGMLDFHNG